MFRYFRKSGIRGLADVYKGDLGRMDATETGRFFSEIPDQQGKTTAHMLQRVTLDALDLRKSRRVDEETFSQLISEICAIAQVAGKAQAAQDLCVKLEREEFMSPSDAAHAKMLATEAGRTFERLNGEAVGRLTQVRATISSLKAQGVLLDGRAQITRLQEGHVGVQG